MIYYKNEENVRPKSIFSNFIKCFSANFSVLVLVIIFSANLENNSMVA